MFNQQVLSRMYKGEGGSPIKIIGMGRKIKDLTGQKFGKWSVVGFAGRYDKETHYFCQCECGTVAEVKAGNLMNGSSTSCGCKRSGKVKERYARERTILKDNMIDKKGVCMLSDEEVIRRLHSAKIPLETSKITDKPYIPENIDQFNDNWMFGL